MNCQQEKLQKKWHPGTPYFLGLQCGYTSAFTPQPRSVLTDDNVRQSVISCIFWSGDYSACSLLCRPHAISTTPMATNITEPPSRWVRSLTSCKDCTVITAACARLDQAAKAITLRFPD